MRAMSNRLGLAKEILDAVRYKRRFWQLLQKDLVLDLKTGEVYVKGGGRWRHIR